jgi:uncharacterized protein YbjT (DUF2867 family)
MKVFVTGGTGNIGSRLVPELVKRGAEVTVLVWPGETDPTKADNLPAGVRSVQGDLLDPVPLGSEFEKVDALFLLAAGELEIFKNLNTVDIAKRAKIKHLVFLSGHDPEGLFMPAHCGVKYLSEYAIRNSGIPYTFIRPNYLMQNDYRHKEALLEQGVYGSPLGDVGVSRADVRDVAEAAAIVLTTPGHEGKAFPIASPDIFTGESTAEVWSQAFNKPVRYIGHDDMDGFEARMSQIRPPYMAHDMRLMYEGFQKNGFIASPEEIERLTALLGRKPRNYYDFVEETAEMWGARG